VREFGKNWGNLLCQKSMRARAFSLIETLVAISLTGLMVGLITTGYRNYNRRQQVETAADRFRQVLNTAKANAAAYRIDCSICGGIDMKCDGRGDLFLYGWRVEMVDGNTFYIRGECGAGHTEFMRQDEDFPPGVNFGPSTSLPSILFKPGGAGTDRTSFSAIIRNSDGYSETVTVSSDGLVQ
jgi:hypothetical protein